MFEFRTGNAKPLKKTFRELSLLCRKLGLYGGEVEAADGTKFRADNSTNGIRIKKL
jgi:hypothetical protein